MINPPSPPFSKGGLGGFERRKSWLRRKPERRFQRKV